ncbi:MAG: DUF4215 domain-containing protein [Streptococcus sp.]|nr:DUF4215 domain-containing protein [Streptococcus sp.]
MANDNIGCKPDCSGPLPGWHCFGGTSTNQDTCFELCNDGVITMSEQCEDGNIVNGDGCGASCTIETGWTCTTAPVPNACTPICGDGK